MTVWGVCMVRDEADIIGWTLPRMAAQLDGVIVADNRSSDETPTILCELSYKWPIHVVEDTEPAYMQSEKMTALAWQAAERGAEWIVPFDADEVWWSPLGPLRDVVRHDDADVIEAKVFDHVVSSMDDVSLSDPVKRITRRRPSALRLPKVACRVRPGLVVEQGNHGARYPGDVLQVGQEIEVRHFPYRSVEQMARKARNGAEAYRAAGDRLPETTGQHWRDYGRLLDERGIEAIEEIFMTWFYGGNTVDDPCPVPMP